MTLRRTAAAAATAQLLVASLLFLLVWNASSSSSTTADDETCKAIRTCKAGDVILDNDQLLVPRSTLQRQNMDVPPSQQLLHVSANGSHEGWLVRVPRRQDDGSILPCHVQMVKRLVARQIVSSTTRRDYYDDSTPLVRDVDLRGPHRLVDEEGRAFPHDTTSNRLHLLLPREAFVHQAVKEGYVRTLSDGKTTLTTLSLHPRVFLVDHFLSVKECEDIIAISSQSLHKSPERHYSDAYKDYRTSWTGTIPTDARLTRKLWHRVKNLTAMPDGGVESPQLLKYDTNTSWYKEHHDFFHNFQSRPLEEIRYFVQTRTNELLRWNISSEISDVLDDDGSSSWIRTFDPIQTRMNNVLANTLIERLQLIVEDEEGTKRGPQRQLHDFLMQHHHWNNEPKSAAAVAAVDVFSNVALLYASELLRSNGAPDPDRLAKKYFQLEGVVIKNNNNSSSTDDNVLPIYYHLEDDYVPYVVKPIQNNRHVTVLPILRAATRGGNTAFPRAPAAPASPPSSSSNAGRSVMGVVEPDADEEFEECRRGLVVKAEAGQALLFYNRLPRGDLDYNSIHAGCPPKEGEKFAVNCFTWDSDQAWAYKFLTDIDVLY